MLSTLLRGLAALGIGVSAGALAAIHPFITEHPWLVFAIGLPCAVLCYVVLSLTEKVWRNLRKRWARRIARWIDYRVRAFFSHYRRRYCDYLRARHRDAKVPRTWIQAPFALELHRLFVDLRLVAAPPHTVNPNLLQEARQLPEGSHAIWDYLAASPLRLPHLVILGPPGSGKTTLLKHITLTLIASRRERAHALQPRIPPKLPILLTLRDHAQKIAEDAGFSLVDAVHEHLRKWPQPLPPREWFRRQLEKGRCLVLLDGLDEVADQVLRQHVRDWAQRQMDAYHQNGFLVTSRPFGYRSNQLDGVHVLEVQLFTPEQVEGFLQKWYLANEMMRHQRDDPGVRMEAYAQANDLLKRLHENPALLDLTVNPLLLTMIATVHQYGGALPARRATLYDQICQVLLGRRERDLALTAEQMRLVLEQLAYYLMVQDRRDLPRQDACAVIAEPLQRVQSHLTPEAFLQMIEEASGLLLQREQGIYGFAHQTFQEYLAASYIRKKGLVHTLTAYLDAPWWQETIRLYCALADATPIIEACLEASQLSASTLALALDCEDEALEIQQEARARLAVLRTNGVEDPDQERQHAVAAAVLTRRLRQMVHLHDETYGDTRLLTCAEYQLFLDERHAQGQSFQPDHWTTPRFPPGEGNKPVLGVRAADASAFCDWLTEWAEGPWRYRLPAAGELRAENTLNYLPLERGCWLQDGQELAWAWETPLSLSADKLIELINAVFDDARALNAARARVNAVLSNLKRTLDRLTRDSSPIPGLDMIQELMRAGALDRVLARAHAVVGDLDRALKKRPIDYRSARPLALALALALDDDLARPDSLARLREHARTRAAGRPLALKRAPALDRIFLLYQTRPSLPQRIGRIFQLGRKASDERDAIQRSLLDLCLDLVILEGRIRGDLPAWEGILLVKEPK